MVLSSPVRSVVGCDASDLGGRSIAMNFVLDLLGGAMAEQPDWMTHDDQAKPDCFASDHQGR
jgi:hypothetical protein